VVIFPRPVSAGILDRLPQPLHRESDILRLDLRHVAAVRIVRKRDIMWLAAAGYRFGEPNLPAKAISLSLKPSSECET
jgi:hypothetical protein